MDQTASGGFFRTSHRNLTSQGLKEGAPSWAPSFLSRGNSRLRSNPPSTSPVRPLPAALVTRSGELPRSRGCARCPRGDRAQTLLGTPPRWRRLTHQLVRASARSDAVPMQPDQSRIGWRARYPDGFSIASISSRTFGSSPTTQASCPGSMTAKSPGASSIFVPSSITTACRPETMYFRWRFWQVSPPTFGFTCSDHSHPGWRVSR